MAFPTRYFVTGLLAASLLGIGAAASAVKTPFAALAGTWSGSGSMAFSDGHREDLRCRAVYQPGEQREILAISLRCASPSFSFDLSSNVADRGGAISGSWSEASRNASGTLSGRSSGDQINVVATGGNFSAALSVTTRGNRQTVAIRPQGSDVTDVSVAMTRR
jgi:hypothetical protein